MEKYIETNWVTSVWGIFLRFLFLIFPAIPPSLSDYFCIYRTVLICFLFSRVCQHSTLCSHLIARAGDLWIIGRYERLTTECAVQMDSNAMC